MIKLLKVSYKSIHKHERASLLIASLANTRYTPRVGFFVFVVKGLQTQLLLMFAELRRICKLEERIGKLNQPFRINSRHFPHVFFCGENQFMINDPFRLTIENGARGMNVDDSTVHQCSITFLWIFLGGVSEEATANRFLHFAGVLSTRDDVQFMSVHDAQKLLANILRTF